MILNPTTTRPSKTWLTTDTHLYHHQLVSNGFRPAGYEEMIYAQWRRLVMPQDRVIHLGDVIFSQAAQLGQILDALPGKKILVRGNHDRESDSWYERHGFTFVCHALLLGGVYLTHAPQASLPNGGVINIHGHLHDDTHRGDSRDLPAFCKLLAIERTDYAPVELDKLAGFTPISKKILMPYEVEA